MTSGSSTAVTAFNEIHASDIYRPAGYALWRLGSEDPSDLVGARAPLWLRRAGRVEDYPCDPRRLLRESRARFCMWRRSLRTANAP